MLDHLAVTPSAFWRNGFLEPLAPPPKPLHVVAQQLMTLVLQQGGAGRSAWRESLLRLLPSMQLAERDVEAILDHMLSRQILVRNRTTFWTFAGLLANSTLASAFNRLGARFDNLSITINRVLRPIEFHDLWNSAGADASARLDESFEVKFNDCLPSSLYAQMQCSRQSDTDAVSLTRKAAIVFRDAG